MNNNDEEYVINCEGLGTPKRIYDWLPYSHHRIKQILRDYYGMRIERVRAYKEGRYPGYKQRYYLYDNTTGELIRKNVRLDAFRCLFASKEFPLHEEVDGRNPRAVEFLEIVDAIARKAQENQ